MSTICAISTPAGIGGISVIRVSGPEAIAYVHAIFKPKNAKKELLTREANTLTFGDLINLETQEVIDEVVVSLYKAPHSFTGEDVVEIACHGSIYLQQEILKLLIKKGARLALAGEFTRRAFQNGRMDLSQAEAVADLISAQSAAANRLALQQMRGGFSKELNQLREQLLHFTTLIELELDFSEEEVEFANRKELHQLADSIAEILRKLTQSFSLGNAIKNGIPVAIVGETNVGKSTILNLLLHEERALVSDVHGTTRDTVEDVMNLQGILFRFIDTAGIRNTTDAVENMGIERTYQKIEQAQIILWIVDCTDVTEHIEWLASKILKRTQGKKVILVLNKIDKIDPEERSILDSFFTDYPFERIYISAKMHINQQALENALIKTAELPEHQSNDIVVTNIRHYEALSHALESINMVQQGLNSSLPSDLLTQDIRSCLYYLGEITGQITSDDILQNIFKNFCIGK